MAPRPLPPLSFRIGDPEEATALLASLGTPQGWDSESSPEELLGPAVRAAANAALEILGAELLDEDGDGPVVASP
jgi:hypothetical protein